MPLFGKKKSAKKATAKKTFPKKATDASGRIAYLERYNEELEKEAKKSPARVASELRATIAANKAEIKKLKKGV